MTDRHLFLFDDREARRWAPFTLTRPVGEILFGCLTLRERAERAFEISCSGHVSRAALVGFDEPGASPGVSLNDVGVQGLRVLLLSRAVVDFQPIELPSTRAQIFVGGQAAGWVLPDGEPLPDEAVERGSLGAPSNQSERLELEGQLLGHPWDLVTMNAARIRSDVEYLWPDETTPEGVIRVGDAVLSLADGATIEPGVYIDLRGGPIRLARGAAVEGPARLVGPLFIGRDSTVLGGAVGTSSIGPACLVRGELAHSVLLGFVNKAHAGYIGHGLLGLWVNLGAFTTNSDLKNNYGNVHVWTPEGKKDSGLTKVGCLLGDHVKTGIGTMLNTGSVVGAGSNVYGGIMPPSVVPPFSWGAGPDLRDYHLEKLLNTTERAMARRGQTLTPGVSNILRTAWQATAGRRTE